MTRFATAQALFDTFPGLTQLTGVEPTEEDPVDFLRRLEAAGRLRAALAVCAHLLPKREAVLWTCHCLRAAPGLTSLSDDGITAAEAWARDPTEERRELAAVLGRSGDQHAPATWAAHAAGFTSGNLAVLPEGPIRVPPHLTAESARVALLLAECAHGGDGGPDFLGMCLAAAGRYLEPRPA